MSLQKGKSQRQTRIWRMLWEDGQDESIVLANKEHHTFPESVQELGRGRDRLHPQHHLSGGAILTDTLILDFKPPDLEDNTFLLFWPPQLAEEAQRVNKDYLQGLCAPVLPWHAGIC